MPGSIPETKWRTVVTYLWSVSATPGKAEDVVCLRCDDFQP